MSFFKQKLFMESSIMNGHSFLYHTSSRLQYAYWNFKISFTNKFRWVALKIKPHVTCTLVQCEVINNFQGQLPSFDRQVFVHITSRTCLWLFIAPFKFLISKDYRFHQCFSNYFFYHRCLVRSKSSRLQEILKRELDTLLNEKYDIRLRPQYGGGWTLLIFRGFVVCYSVGLSWIIKVHFS